MARTPLHHSTPFSKEGREAHRIEVSDPFTKTLWRRLLATLIDENGSRIPEMQVFLEPDDIAEDMPFERKVFRVLHHLNNSNIAPSPDMVLNGLVISEEMAADNAEAQLAVLVEERVEGVSTIQALAHFVGEEVKVRRNHKAWQVALGIVTGQKGTAVERQEAAMNIVTNATKSEVAFDQGEGSEVLSDFFEWATVRYDEFKSGNKVSGPMLPWFGFSGENGMLPAGLDWGDQTLITAKSGRGKSTIVGQIAEANAYGIEVCDVLVILLETNLMKMKTRSLARNCYIPYDLVQAKQFNPKDPRFNRVDEQGKPLKHSLGWYKNWITESSCEINYAFAPGSSVYEISSLMAVYRRKAEARGKGLLVIVDYFQKIDWGMFGYDQRTSFERIADIIRDTVEIQNNKSPLHMIMMAQENDGDDPYGGRGILQRSQMHLSLQRYELESDGFLGDLVISNQTNAIGGQRYYHRTKDKFNSEAIFIARKANDAPPGDIKVRFENSMYRIHSHEAEIKKQNELARQ